jgi:hypothetical protein
MLCKGGGYPLTSTDKQKSILPTVNFPRLENGQENNNQMVEKGSFRDRPFADYRQKPAALC